MNKKRDKGCDGGTRSAPFFTRAEKGLKMEHLLEVKNLSVSINGPAGEVQAVRFLFQTNEFIGKNISELINSEELQPIIAILSKEVEVNTEQAKTIFRSLFLIAHGYASMFANNEMTYDEQTIISDLDLVFDGTVYSLKGGL